MKISKPPFDHATFLDQLRVFLPCHHPSPEPRRKIKEGNHQPYYRIQCGACGAPLSSQLSYSVVEDFQKSIGAIQDWNYQRENEWLVRRLHFGRLLRDDQNLKRHEHWWKEYEIYLGSFEWKVRRDAILRRCSHVCEECGNNPATQVHHLTYERVGEELV